MKKDIVKEMEEKYPNMTKEFKKLQKEQYELFAENSTIMALKTYL